MNYAHRLTLIVWKQGPIDSQAVQEVKHGRSYSVRNAEHVIGRFRRDQAATAAIFSLTRLFYADLTGSYCQAWSWMGTICPDDPNSDANGYTCVGICKPEPRQWMGHRRGLCELLGDGVSMQIPRREQVSRYRSPQHFVHFFCTHDVLIERAWAAINTESQQELNAGLIVLVDRRNTATNGTVAAPGTHLEVVAAQS